MTFDLPNNFSQSDACVEGAENQIFCTKFFEQKFSPAAKGRE
jgi:hypothetical protein